MQRIPRHLLISIAAGALSILVQRAGSSPPAGSLPYAQTIRFDGEWRQGWDFEEGQAVEILVHVPKPSALPPNARLDVQWEAPSLPEWRFEGKRGDLNATASASWTKTLHATDPDVYFVYRAPKTGTYSLVLKTVTDRAQLLGEIPHDTGLAPLATPLPERTPEIRNLNVRVEVRPLPELTRGDIVLEAEPNSTPEQAVALPFAANDEDQVLRVIGGADELEYYNNAAAGKSPDDWYRVEYRGGKAKILTANLQMAEPVVSARIRVYKPGQPTSEELSPRELLKSEDLGQQNPVPYVHPPAEIIPGPTQIYTYYQGRDINEREHQQDTAFRTYVTRELQPGGVYYLRVEANQPAYELEVRLLDPAPYDDPRKAVERATYYHLAEIDSWLMHRPRGIAANRRVRDGTSLFGENCMSCHTQSGVWGVADAFRNGYRPDGTVQNWRRLVNTMYESLRPTIKLHDGASNTSLAPNDLGDAPAGSRVAGRNIVLHERAFQPKKLHGYQQRRTANYVLQTADPEGINAAGKGSNFGPNVVFKFAGEILERAWKDTKDPRYFFGLEEKAKKIVATGTRRIKVSDDLGHRIEFFYRLWPKDYAGIIRRLTNSPERVAEAENFQREFAAQVAADIQHLLVLQQDNGSWGFDIGATPDGGKTWKRLDDSGDPASTAVALIGLHAAGYKADDPVIQRATQWLLRDQFPYGLWNHAAQTGFVTTAYTIRALSQLFPKTPPVWKASDFDGKRGESFLETLSRVRRLQTTGDEKLAQRLIEAAGSPHPQVRYQALLGIGGALAQSGVPALIAHLDDPVKACREAAFWSLRQLLLDDKGWPETFAAYAAGGDLTRQSILQALVTRADLAGPKSAADVSELARVLTAGMSDPFAGSRAWAYKAAWHWWVWNPPARQAINRAWVDALARQEQEAAVEMALRYSTVSLLIVNGQIANQTGGKNEDQQYPELAELYKQLQARRKSASAEQALLLDRRLTAIVASHFQERGGDGGPGQMGYSTPGSNEFFGEVVLATYEREQGGGTTPWKKIALQGAANINHEPLQERLLSLLTTGDPDMVAIAARALSNPQALSLPAQVTTLRPLLDRIDEFLRAGRTEDAQALADFLSRVKWDFDGVHEQGEKDFYQLLIPAAKPQAQTAPGTRGAALKPAPADSKPLDASDQRAALAGHILGENPTLQRKVVFDHVAGDARFWLPSTEWMVSFQEGGLTMEEAVEGATEAEDLKVTELTFGRTTEQIVPNGLASKNTVLWWREGIAGAQLTFVLQAPEAGRYDLLAAFLYDREMGTVQFALNGETIGEPMDFYKPNLVPSGPVSLGVHEFKKGENLLVVKMLGMNPEAEPNYIFGLDYIKLMPDKDSGTLFTKDERGVDVIDPIVTAKEEVVRMFTSWFSTDSPRKVRELAVNMANKKALRRNPEVRKVLAAYVEREAVPVLKLRIQNILNSDDEVYGEQLRKLIEEQGPSESTEVRRLESTPEFIKDLLYFRDYVFVEMSKINQEDGRACISCHSVPGRVPTLYLDPPDAAGYIAPEQLLSNYRKMQQRVDLDSVERSKFLRKPLNVQDGEEDGHQGGQRFESSDTGYQIIRQWALRQTQLQAHP